MQGGYFSSSYTLFTIKTSPFGWTVKRRFGDFQFLRNNIQKLFPGKVIPPIPSKKKKSFENEFIKKRRIFLEEYLNQLLMIEEVKNS